MRKIGYVLFFEMVMYGETKIELFSDTINSR